MNESFTKFRPLRDNPKSYHFEKLTFKVERRAQVKAPNIKNCCFVAVSEVIQVKLYPISKQQILVLVECA